MGQCYQVQPSERLLRWLHPGQFNWEEKRPTSAAFKDSYMSVDICQLTTVDDSYERGKKIGKNAVASFSAEEVLNREQEVVYCPTQVIEGSDGCFACQVRVDCPVYRGDIASEPLVCVNNAHGCVIGKKTQGFAKALAKNCKVEIYPT